MALRPCAVCGVRFKGPAVTCYVFISSGPSSGRYKMGYCSRHGAQFVEKMDEELQRVDPAVYANYTVDRCMFCVLPIEQESAAVIVTAYPSKSDQVQWLGATHPTCQVPEALGYWLQNGSTAA